MSLRHLERTKRNTRSYRSRINALYSRLDKMLHRSSCAGHQQESSKRTRNGILRELIQLVKKILLDDEVENILGRTIPDGTAKKETEPTSFSLTMSTANALSEGWDVMQPSAQHHLTKLQMEQRQHQGPSAGPRSVPQQENVSFTEQTLGFSLPGRTSSICQTNHADTGGSTNNMHTLPQPAGGMKSGQTGRITSAPWTLLPESPASPTFRLAGEDYNALDRATGMSIVLAPRDVGEGGDQPGYASSHQMPKQPLEQVEPLRIPSAEPQPKSLASVVDSYLLELWPERNQEGHANNSGGSARVTTHPQGPEFVHSALPQEEEASSAAHLSMGET